MFVSSAKIRNDNLAKSSDDWDDDVPAAADTPREKRTAAGELGGACRQKYLFLI